MKTRTGFVSNSSSSSFIIVLPHKPRTVNGLRKMMYNDYGWKENIFVC